MATCSEIPRHILITGLPGVGKTTLIRHICNLLKKEMPTLNLSGFYTEEVRDPNHGQRIGFDIVDILNDRRASLASINAQPVQQAPHVGKYTVTLQQFEPLALECLTKGYDQHEKRVIVIDEIGKMEAFSKPFVAEVERLFGDGHPNLVILATIPVDRGHGIPAIVNKVKHAQGNRLITVTKENRDRLAKEVIDLIGKAIG